ncbi:MAG: dihydropteroate synthase [Bacteroidales bacterium]|nr:dihydropteroate synthase [Bacteroidales bacterium]
MDLSDPAIMGVINITPDSFFSHSRTPSTEAAIARAGQFIDEGAKIIDIGAVSTRPGAKDISYEQEVKRLAPIIKAIREHFPDVIISIDTSCAKTVDKLSSLGIDIINDISGGNADKNMYDAIADNNFPYILMHMQGTPADMQINPNYDNVVHDVIQSIAKRTELLYTKGVNDIIIDPGFGFGKTIDHNYTLLNHLDLFVKLFKLPLLAGFSRKRMLYNVTGRTPEESLPATAALHLMALTKGVNILRVHDVADAFDIVKIFKKLEENNG